jgi:hypothetical protein
MSPVEQAAAAGRAGLPPPVELSCCRPSSPRCGLIAGVKVGGCGGHVVAARGASSVGQVCCRRSGRAASVGRTRLQPASVAPAWTKRCCSNASNAMEVVCWRRRGGRLVAARGAAPVWHGLATLAVAARAGAPVVHGLAALAVVRCVVR